MTTAVRRLHNNIIIVVVGVVAESGARTDLVLLALRRRRPQSHRARAVRPRAPVDAILHDIPNTVHYTYVFLARPPANVSFCF